MKRKAKKRGGVKWTKGWNPKIICGNPNPECGWYMETKALGGTYIIRVPLLEETLKALLPVSAFCHVRTRGEVGHLQTRKLPHQTPALSAP